MLTVAGHDGGVCSCSNLHRWSGLAARDTAGRQQVNLVDSNHSNDEWLDAGDWSVIVTSLDSPGRAAVDDLETESDNYTHLFNAEPTDGTYVMHECEKLTTSSAVI